MLARPSTVEAVGALAATGVLAPLVVDPVLVSSTGHPLMEDGGTQAYRDALIPQAMLLTPNLREAAVLLGLSLEELDSVAAMADAGRALVGLGATACLIKGGHLLAAGVTAERAPDVLVGPQGVVELDAPRIQTRNDHGTGCSTAAAIAAGLARGLSLGQSVEEAKAFVHGAISRAASWELGRGHGPIDHLGWGDGAQGRPLP